MEKAVKIYSNYEDYKVYKIEEYSGKYYVKRFEQFNLITADDYDDIGSAKSFEDAMTLARMDASRFGSIYKVEFD